MKAIIFFLVIMTYCKTVGHAIAKEKNDIPNSNNVIIITIDGLRWQEIFRGADSSLIHNKKYTGDTAFVKQFFWGGRPEQRKKKLMPFFWNIIAEQGELFGNRRYNNNVNVSNFYALSYPGYNEIFTANTDLLIATNKKINNRNISFLEYLNGKNGFQGRVASFTSWNVFPFIFNEARSKLHINSSTSLIDKAVMALRKEKEGETRSDITTYNLAKEYLLKKHPRVLHIGLSGTDEYGHKKQYDQYLFHANLADKIIGWMWQLTQSIPFYKDNTTFIITTDHGRGDNKNNWYKHGLLVDGSSQTWMALIGNGVKNIGECRQPLQLYQKQVAGTVGYFLNSTSFSNYSIPISYFNEVVDNGLLSAK